MLYLVKIRKMDDLQNSKNPSSIDLERSRNYYFYL